MISLPGSPGAIFSGAGSNVSGSTVSEYSVPAGTIFRRKIPIRSSTVQLRIPDVKTPTCAACSGIRSVCVRPGRFFRRICLGLSAVSVLSSNNTGAMGIHPLCRTCSTKVTSSPRYTASRSVSAEIRIVAEAHSTPARHSATVSSVRIASRNSSRFPVASAAASSVEKTAEGIVRCAFIVLRVQVCSAEFSAESALPAHLSF